MRSLVPLSTIRDLKCCHCQRFATCGPIYAVPPAGGILCGRCTTYAKPEYRNLAYEGLASLFLHPCCFWPQHCNTTLPWNDIHQHELNCAYSSTCRKLFTGTFCSSQRTIPDEPPRNFRAITEDVLAKLRCDACDNYISASPVYLAPDGNNICHRCVNANGAPKHCLRNIAYEKLATVVLFPCIYRYRGCAIRMRFGRDLWQHEGVCPYGPAKPTTPPVKQKITKKPLNKDGKERGVIPTHSGHVWGTITPGHVPFAPPKATTQSGDVVTKELEKHLRKKNNSSDDEEHFRDYQSLDSQSIESIDNNSRRYITENGSVDNMSRGSSRPGTREENFSTGSRDSYVPGRFSGLYRNESYLSNQGGILPRTTPAGFNKMANNSNGYGYYTQNLEIDRQFAFLGHFPPVMNAPENESPSQYNLAKSNSFRVGNQGVIDEIKLRQKRQHEKRDSSTNPYENPQDVSETRARVDDYY